MSVFVILPAAGIGTRMASAAGSDPKAAPKQFLSLKGTPILVHSLRAFLAVPEVSNLYVAVRESEKPRIDELLAEFNLDGKISVDPATITRTIQAIEKHGAAIVGTPAVDTIKQVERTADGALITATIPRELIVHAQTPQGARVPLMRKAFAEAAADDFTGTDEASLLERAGIPVFVVPGHARNFKVTQPGDLEIAEFYLAG